MNKSIILLSIFAGILSAGCSNQNIGNNTIENGISGQQSNIEPKTKEYYDSYRKKCEGSQCCLGSVSIAEKANSFIYSRESTFADFECPEGFQRGANKCPESYKWCEPIIKK